MLQPELYTLKIDFIILVNKKEFLKSIHVNNEGDKTWMVATHILSNETKRLFPYFNELQIRPTFTISVEHHRNYKILSNMPIKYQRPVVYFEVSEDYLYTHFYTTPPISIYHQVIVMTNYSSIHINQNVSLWCRDCSTKHSLNFAKRVIETVTLYLQSEFEKVKIPKIDHFVILKFPQDGISSKWGLIFHREIDIICNEELDPFMRKLEIARLIALKIVYQWFGTAVSSTFWSSHWLFNSLGSLFGEEAVVKVFNNSGIMNFFIVRNQYESLSLGSFFDMNPHNKIIESIYPNFTLFMKSFSISPYSKAPIVLRMLQNSMTDTVFRKGVQTFLYKYTIIAIVAFNDVINHLYTAEQLDIVSKMNLISTDKLFIELLYTVTILTCEELNNFILNDFRPKLAPYLIPIHYKVNLTAYFVRKTLMPTNVQMLTMADREIFKDTYFNGTTHIMINILHAIKSIKLHIQTVNIKHSSIQLIDIHKIKHSPNKTIYDSTKNILQLDFMEVIYPGLYTLKICTTSRISNYNSEKNLFVNTNYRSNDLQGMWSIAPNIQDIGAKTLFPCWDEPHLKTTFLVSVRHNPHFNVLSNMPIRETLSEFNIKDNITEYIQWTHNGNTQWTNFYSTPPISTYQFVIVINHMSKVEFKEKIEDKLSMTLWCKWKYCSFEKVVATRHKSLDLCMYIINKLTLHMKSEFKEIKFPKIDHIVLPNCPHNITSKWGVIFYSDTDILYDYASDLFMRKIEFERRIAYKIAQQWFGYPVSSTWLNNIWLHDGLATFFAEDAIAKIYNDSQLMNLFIVQNQYDSLNLDSYYNLNFPIINTVPNFESLLNSPRYIKGQYRVYYDSENWLNIANYLNSGKYEDVNVIDRAKFIDDAFHMIIDHQLNGSVFWNLTKHLSQETDYVAWFPMIKALEYISTVFKLSTVKETNFAHVKNTLKTLLVHPMEILGFEEHPNEDNFIKCLRHEILKWACILGDNQCLTIAKQKLQLYLLHSTRNK
ncbi:Aminopeptidase Q [Cyphomyrmex costatus]|uniref:Aminopeptidase Q n=1 Tax=Cyphomyrmex costatus TaxID=456900 RepID=A0A195CC92_9HYME|nr:Aminopeptidase Q [Cyphomyrmex costatus]